MRHQDGTVEAVIAELARVRHGVVTRRRLLAAGVTLAEVRSRLRSGSLLLEYPGVYRVGHQAPSREATYLAAVEACGNGALLLRGRAAAHLHRLIRGPAPPPEVVAPSERRIEGILTCRSRRMDPRDATVVLGIPVTTVARTLVDLAAVLDAGALARACHEAGVLHRTTPGEVEAVLARRPRSPGAGRLRAVMRGDVKVTLSTLERSFLRLLRAEGLPLPVTNRPAGRPPRRLPLARATPDGRARQLPLPPLPARLGAGPPARTRGACPRRRVPPLHLRRRLRGASTHARRAPKSAAPSRLVSPHDTRTGR